MRRADFEVGVPGSAGKYEIECLVLMKIVSTYKMGTENQLMVLSFNLIFDNKLVSPRILLKSAGGY